MSGCHRPPRAWLLPAFIGPRPTSGRGLLGIVILLPIPWARRRAGRGQTRALPDRSPCGPPGSRTGRRRSVACLGAPGSDHGGSWRGRQRRQRCVIIGSTGRCADRGMAQIPAYGPLVAGASCETLDAARVAPGGGAMAKHKHDRDGAVADDDALPPDAAGQAEEAPVPHKLGKKFYEKELTRLSFEMVKLQYWVIKQGLRVVILFEGRDAAGKGGLISRIITPLNPRGVRHVALTKPSDVERTQWYFQRYVDHLPSAGELVIFDRSWYN